MDVFGTTTALGALILVFLIVLAILWFLLPFAVFGVKPLLAEILLELQLLRAQYSSSLPGNPSGSNVTDDPKPSGDHVGTLGSGVIKPKNVTIMVRQPFLTVDAALTYVVP